jgi:hypothetical protein
MNRLLFLGVLLLVGAPKLQAQFELKTNVFSAIGGMLELSPEWTTGDHSAFGLSLSIEISEGSSIQNDGLVTDNWAVLPYYRYYLGKKESASGFFAEANLAIYQEEGLEMDETIFGAGLALGSKFFLSDSWLLEIFAGGGFAFDQDAGSSTFDTPVTYPRLGVAVGKRF